MSESIRQTNRWFDAPAAMPIPGPSDWTRTAVSNGTSGPTAGVSSALARVAAASASAEGCGSRGAAHANRLSARTTTAIWLRALTRMRGMQLRVSRVVHRVVWRLHLEPIKRFVRDKVFGGRFDR